MIKVLKNILIIMIVYSSNIESISNSTGKLKFFLKGILVVIKVVVVVLLFIVIHMIVESFAVFIDNSWYNENSSSIYRSIFSSNNIDGKVCI